MSRFKKSFELCADDCYQLSKKLHRAIEDNPNGFDHSMKAQTMELFEKVLRLRDLAVSIDATEKP